MRSRALRAAAMLGVTGLLGVLAAAPAAAQQPRERAPSGMIWVEMPQQPRQPQAEGVRIELAVETFATTARGATGANEHALQRVLRVLASLGVPQNEVETRGMAIFPQYARREIIPTRTIRGELPRVAGYVAVSRLSLRARDAAHAGLLIDLAQGAGANLVAAEQR